VSLISLPQSLPNLLSLPSLRLSPLGPLPSLLSPRQLLTNSMQPLIDPRRSLRRPPLPQVIPRLPLTN